MPFTRYKSGALLSPKDERDYQISDLISCAPASALPSEYINPLVEYVEILDQGTSQACVACSLAYLRFLTEWTQSQNKKQFSPSYLYGNRDSFGYTGEGMIPREAISRLKNYGMCFFESFPGFYDVNTAVSTYRKNRETLDKEAYPYRISSYYSVSGEAGIKNTILKIGGVTASFPVYECLYMPDKDGKINFKIGNNYGNHMMTIVGWTADNYWIVLNSWGDWYGDHGICYIPFNYPIVEAWAVVDEVKEVLLKMARFIDTEGTWAEASIDKAAEKGIVSGFEDGTFRPDEGVTRAQLVAILDRLGLLD